MKCVAAAVLSEVDYTYFLGINQGLGAIEILPIHVFCVHSVQDIHVFCQNQPAFFHGVLETNLNMGISC